MTTNQTIDGVPRDLREEIKALADQYENVCIPGLLSAPIVAQKLRALLDAPACKTCKGAGYVSDGEIDCFADGTPYENGPVACIKDCPDCKTAAQPQGEPVAWMLDGSVGGSSLDFQITDLLETQNRHGGCLVPLYAEQPAPVAVLLAEAREWIGDGKHADGLDREHWTPEYAALIDRIDATLRK